MVNGRAHYKDASGLLTPQSHNVVGVSPVGGGLYDITFAHISRTGDAEKFRISVAICIRDTGHGSGKVTAIGGTTVTVRIQTCSITGVAANRDFCCDMEELG